MKKVVLSFVLIVLCFSLASCGRQRYENSFFEDDKLSFNLVPELPQPENASMVLVDTDHGNKSRVYIDSDQSVEDYFQDVIEYIEPLNFTFCGTVDTIKDTILGKETSYYFHSTKTLSSILASNYYFEEENAYIIIYSNGWIENKEEGNYLKDSHLIKVICQSGVYEPQSHIGDDYYFEYDYFIDFGYEPSIWFNDTIGAFQLEVIDEGNHIINKSPAIDTWYAPGTLLRFYANPIMDADLAMYLNGEFHSIQTSIETDDGYVWEYCFEMPDRDTTIEFKIEGDYPLGDGVSQKVETIIDIALRDSLPTDDALEWFYSDNTYNYYFSSIRSDYVIVYYNDGSEQTVKDAIAEGKIKISDLDIFGINYIKTNK